MSSAVYNTLIKSLPKLRNSCKKFLQASNYLCKSTLRKKSSGKKDDKSICEPKKDKKADSKTASKKDGKEKKKFKCPVPPKTISQTDSKQPNLLRYPALPLGDTMKKFLKSCEPLLTKEEYKCTKALADEFQSGIGCKLQNHLEECASNETNWLAYRWLKGAYLEDRNPVTVISSPGHVFPYVELKSDQEYVEYAAKWIYGLLAFKVFVDTDQIPIVKYGGLELDNSQFGKVLGTYRIPLRTMDELVYHPNSKHVIVLYKNHVGL